MSVVNVLWVVPPIAPVHSLCALLSASRLSALVASLGVVLLAWVIQRVRALFLSSPSMMLLPAGLSSWLCCPRKESGTLRGHRTSDYSLPSCLTWPVSDEEENTRRPAVFFCGLTSDSPCLPCPGIRTTCAQKCMKLVVLLERQWIPAAHVCFVEVENC